MSSLYNGSGHTDTTLRYKLATNCPFSHSNWLPVCLYRSPRSWCHHSSSFLSLPPPVSLVSWSLGYPVVDYCCHDKSWRYDISSPSRMATEREISAFPPPSMFFFHSLAQWFFFLAVCSPLHCHSSPGAYPWSQLVGGVYLTSILLSLNTRTS